MAVASHPSLCAGAAAFTPWWGAQDPSARLAFLRRAVPHAPATAKEAAATQGGVICPELCLETLVAGDGLLELFAARTSEPVSTLFARDLGTVVPLGVRAASATHPEGSVVMLKDLGKQLQKGAIVSPKPGKAGAFDDLKRTGFAVDLDAYYAAEIRQLTLLQALEAVLAAWTPP